MAFFNNREKDKEKEKRKVTQEVSKPTPKPKQKTTVATVISKNINVAGTFTGSDAIQVDGVLDGDIILDSVSIGQTGVVNGSIKAKHVSIEGKLNGNISCNDLRITKSGKVSDRVHVQNLILEGEVTGEIYAEKTITVTETGRANAKRLESKRVIVNGKIDGKITASELLDVGRNGFVQGEITVRNIKTEEGGRVIGTMVNYTQPAIKAPAPSKKKEEIINTKIV